MHLEWPSIFSIFHPPKISRPGSDTDTRNIRLAGNYFNDLRETPWYDPNATSGSVPILKTEALASTSATIINAGLHKVWQTAPKVSFHGRPSEPGFRVPSAPLQKVINEEQPLHTTSLEAITTLHAATPDSTSLCPKASQSDSKSPTPEPSTSVGLDLRKPVETLGRIAQRGVAPILTHLPLPRISQPDREPYTPAHPQHSSGSRFLSFALQRAAYKKLDSEQSIIRPSIAGRPVSTVPQPATTPLLSHLSLRTGEPEFDATDKKPILLGSSAANGSESSTPRDVELNLFKFIAGQTPLPSVSSPQATLFNYLPNISSPAQPLLFLPPNPPPQRMFIFNPFSPEEDTISLSPARELKINPFGITYPVGSPDHEFPTNTLPSWLLSPVHSPVPVHSPDKKPAVPGSPLFPTQSSDTTSPLSIDLLLSPQPVASPPSELIINITGSEAHLDVEYGYPHVTHFLLSRATEVANSLVIVWQLCPSDSGGARGFTSLKALFAQLDEEVLDSERTALSSFTKLSVTVPDLVNDVATPYNHLLHPVEEDNSIDLRNAMSLFEFTWHGDFITFASKFKNLSFATLTCLSMKSSHISIGDAVVLLHSCPELEEANLGTIQHCNIVLPFKTTGVQRKALPKLIHLTLDSNVALDSLIRQIRWTAQISLSLTLRNEGAANIHDLPLRWQSIFALELNCHLTSQELHNIQKVFPSVKYHNPGI